MGLTMKTTVTEIRQNISANTTTFTLKSTVTSTYGSRNLDTDDSGAYGTYCVYESSEKSNVLISKTKFKHTFNGKEGESVDTVVLQRDITVAHKSDGTRTICAVVIFNGNTGAAYSSSDIKNTVSKTFTTIPRASTVSATDCYIGKSSTVTVTRNAMDFRDTIAYGYGEKPTEYIDIVKKTANKSLSLTVPEEAYEKCKTSDSVTVAVRCTTYNGTTELGANTCTFKAKVDKVASAPEVSIDELRDVNTHTTGLTGDTKKYIKGVSRLYYEMSGITKMSATLKSLVFTYGNQSNTEASGTVDNISVNSVTAKITDSRGFTASKTEDLNMIDYTGLSIAGTVERKSTTGDTVLFSLNGMFFNGNFGAKENKLTVKYRTATTREDLEISDYIEVAQSPTLSGGKYSLSFEASGFDYQKAYYIEITAFDTVYDGSEGYAGKSIVKQLRRGTPVFDWGKDCFNFNVPVTITGGEVWNTNNLQLVMGIAKIETTANEIAKHDVYFPDGVFTKEPYVFLTPITGVPGTQVLGVGISDCTKEKVTINLLRTTDTITWVQWLAIQGECLFEKY